MAASQTPVATNQVLLYDADCGFCTASAAWFQRRAGELATVQPWQRADLAALGLPESEAPEQVWWCDDQGCVGGADACARAMRACPWPWRASGYLLGLPGVLQLARLLYPVIARNRFRLPGSTDACRL